MMEAEFFELYGSQDRLSLECGHNAVADWVLIVRDKTGTCVGQQGEQIFHIQDCDRRKVFAEGYYRLAEYLSDTRGGY